MLMIYTSREETEEYNRLQILCNQVTESKKSPAYYTGAHKKVIPEITIMASVRRGW